MENSFSIKHNTPAEIYEEIKKNTSTNDPLIDVATEAKERLNGIA